MKKVKILPLIFFGMILAGCSGAFWGGAGTGVVGTGAGYEINIQRQMNRIDEDLKNGTITQQEYDIRKDQIQRDSLLK
ncbi:MAG: hypothetical protein PHE18_04515 [Candidatus Omnitrophica bacterium]|nr:hypothetical protein [Candidatus Omnitrophota bacterium]MDD5553122.1 hypothetical protein [Candidatus Omnitrophota bacterium]